MTNFSILKPWVGSGPRGSVDLLLIATHFWECADRSRSTRAHPLRTDASWYRKRANDTPALHDTQPHPCELQSEVGL
eukprot:5932492-Amphidinium_carterae.2